MSLGLFTGTWVRACCRRVSPCQCSHHQRERLLLTGLVSYVTVAMIKYRDPNQGKEERVGFRLRFQRMRVRNGGEGKSDSKN